MITLQPPVFGPLLRQHRRAAGLTQEALAERASVSVRAISDLERGVKSRPHRDTVTLLADALGLAPHDRALFDVAAGRVGRRFDGRHLSAPPRDNLPGRLTGLIGREQDDATVAHLLCRADVRLLTLTGPGGVGKTRLALQVATGLCGHYRHGVCFVDLAPIDDPTLVLPALAQALELDGRGAVLLRDSLTAYLGGRHLLLLFDNFEHVLPAAPGLAELLTACPGLTALVTSRAALHVQGEHEFLVPPLALPVPTRLPQSDALAQYAAVALFVQRAQAVRPAFQLTAANAPVVATICACLDGLPLALELAAAWLKVLPPQALLTRLERRLEVLTGGGHDAPARHQTMRDAIAWSHDLLDARQRAVFRRLAVFVGGWSLEAAEAVCADVPMSPPLLPRGARGVAAATVLDTVASLVDKSLLHAEEQTHGEPRFTMLETIHAYALEQLAESGEAKDVRWRHATHYLRLATAAEPEIHGPRQAAWYDQLDREHGNLRATVNWAVEQGEPEHAMQAVAGLWLYYSACGFVSEAREWLAALLAVPVNTIETPGRASALSAAGMLALQQGDQTETHRLLHKSLGLQRRLQDRAGISQALFCLGQTAASQGDYATARTLHEESLVLRRELGDAWLVGFSLTNLAVVAVGQGDYTLAQSLFEEGLALRHDAGDGRGVAGVHLCLADLAIEQNDSDRAAALYREGLAGATELGEMDLISQVLAGLAAVAVMRRQMQRALRLVGAADALFDQLGTGYSHFWHHRFERRLEPVRQEIAQGAGALTWAEGHALSLEEAIACALTPDEQGRTPQPATLRHGQPDVTRNRARTSLPLTRREREVATLIAHGFTNRRIAAELVIADRTAETHVEHILSKLGLASRAQIAVWAVEHDLLMLEQPRQDGAANTAGNTT